MNEKSREALENLLIEARNIHREYLDTPGGCPCTSDTFEACPLSDAIQAAVEALEEK